MNFKLLLKYRGMGRRKPSVLDQPKDKMSLKLMRYTPYKK